MQLIPRDIDTEALYNLGWLSGGTIRSSFPVGREMEISQFRDMPLDQLWELHAELSQILADRLTEERKRLEVRLRKVQRPQQRTYPAMQYRNPSNPSETWVGYGRRPRWVIELLRSGKKLDDLRG